MKPPNSKRKKKKRYLSTVTVRAANTYLIPAHSLYKIVLSQMGFRLVFEGEVCYLDNLRNKGEKPTSRSFSSSTPVKAEMG